IRYTYSIIAEFSDEVVHCGRVTVKAKKKFKEMIEKNQHEYAFVVRVRSKYDVDVVLQHIENDES
ncbi:hypothetical protein K8T06_03180, partial [bacterium]|nr:hypothetical protein [bacterium]